jgi:hypothetical protein
MEDKINMLKEVQLYRHYNWQRLAKKVEIQTYSVSQNN